MNFYEHTIIARQDTSPSQLKQIEEKYTNLVNKNEGNVVKVENWGLLNISYLIKKNKKEQNKKKKDTHINESSYGIIRHGAYK